jgi:hypothetical protein
MRIVEVFGKNDPYIALSLRGTSWRARTSVLSDAGGEAEWSFGPDNSEMVLEVAAVDLQSSALSVEVFDANQFRKDVMIGRGEVPVPQCEGEGEAMEVRVELEDSAGRSSGQVVVSFSVREQQQQREKPVPLAAARGETVDEIAGDADNCSVSSKLAKYVNVGDSEVFKEKKAEAERKRVRLQEEEEVEAERERVRLQEEVEAEAERERVRL